MSETAQSGRDLLLAHAGRGPGTPAAIESQDTVIRYPGIASERYDQVTANGVCPSTDRTPRGFTVRSVRIDNFTSQWLFAGPELNFVPPYTVNIVLNVRGRGNVSIQPVAPPGLAQPAEIDGQHYYLTLYDKPQLLNPAGVTLPIAAIWRAGAQPVVTTKAAAAFGGQTITVPAGGPAWLIDALALLLTTTATLGNRFLATDFKDAAGNAVLTVLSTAAVAPSSARNLWETVGGQPGSTTTINAQDFIDLPWGLVVPAGGTVAFREVPNVDAADTLAVELVASPVV